MEVVSQVQRSSQISSNLAVSRSLNRVRSVPSSSSPLVGPRSSGAPRGRPYGKRSSSSSRSGGRKRFKGGKGAAPSSKPTGFRKWEPSPFRTLSGGCLSFHWQAWRDRGAEPWVVEVLRFGYRIPFLSTPPLSATPVPMPSYSPTSTRGAALEEVTLGLIAKGAVELAPLPSLGFYSHLFVVWKTSGSWRPVIDLSHLNRFVDVSHFQMETIQSVLLSVRQGDWMASIDLKEAYHQVPVHPDSRHFLRFVSKGHVFQFKALCFGLSTAPQVFSRVMAPVSAILHSMGICMRRYLDDWLVQSSSRESLLRDLHTVLDLCHDLGIVVNPQKSHLVPSQEVQYLGVVINAETFMASPSQERISRLQSTAAAFRSSASPPASLWLSLLGMCSSLAHLVPGGRLRMRSLQLCLHRSWNRHDLSAGSGDFVGGVSLQPPVVASHSSPLPRCLSLPGVSRPRLLVRRLGRGLGCPSRSAGRFRPVGLTPGCAVHQPQRAAGYPARSPPVSVVSARSHRGGLLRQCHGSSLSPQGRGHQVSFAERHHSGDPAVVGVSFHPSGSSIHPGLQQCPGGRSVSPTPAPTFRVVPQHDRLSVFVSTVAGPNRFVCDLRQSSLFDIFFSLPGSAVSRHGRVPPVLERSTGLHISSIFHHSPESSRSSGPLGGRSSLLWLRTGLSALGSRTCSSYRWPLQLFFQTVPTSCTCLDLSFFTRVSMTSGFMPGETPAVHQGCRILLNCSGAVFTSAPPILSRYLSASLVDLQILVSRARPFHFSPSLGKGGQFPLLVAVYQRP